MKQTKLKFHFKEVKAFHLDLTHYVLCKIKIVLKSYLRRKNKMSLSKRMCQKFSHCQNFVFVHFNFAKLTCFGKPLWFEQNFRLFWNIILSTFLQPAPLHMQNSTWIVPHRSSFERFAWHRLIGVLAGDLTPSLIILVVFRAFHSSLYGNARGASALTIKRKQFATVALPKYPLFSTTESMRVR